MLNIDLIKDYIDNIDNIEKDISINDDTINGFVEDIIIEFRLYLINTFEVLKHISKISKMDVYRTPKISLSNGMYNFSVLFLLSANKIIIDFHSLGEISIYPHDNIPIKHRQPIAYNLAQCKVELENIICQVFDRAISESDRCIEIIVTKQKDKYSKLSKHGLDELNEKLLELDILKEKVKHKEIIEETNEVNSDKTTKTLNDLFKDKPFKSTPVSLPFHPPSTQTTPFKEPFLPNPFVNNKGFKLEEEKDKRTDLLFKK